MRNPFLRFFSWILEAIVLLFHRLKGPSSLREVPTGLGQESILKGESVSGYEINIYCYRKQYRRKYDRWYVPTEYQVLYRVFSRVSDNAPARLKKVCASLDRDIRPQLPEFLSEDLQKRAAVEAYLQLLQAALVGAEDGFNSGWTRPPT